MKNILAGITLALVCAFGHTAHIQAQNSQNKKVTATNSEVIQMDKAMFLKEVFNYEKSKDWKYQGNKPAIIDLSLFNATSIPLFVFIPMKGEPQLMRGAADKDTYKKAIDSFLLK